MEDGWGRIVDGGGCKNVVPKAGRDRKRTQKRHSPFIKHGGLEGDDDLSQTCWGVSLWWCSTAGEGLDMMFTAPPPPVECLDRRKSIPH